MDVTLVLTGDLTRERFHGIYECGNKPALLISTLEAALAVLIALKLYYGDDPGKWKSLRSVTLVPYFYR